MSKWLLPDFALCLALAFFAAACRDVHPQSTENGPRTHDAETFEDSGRRLAGDFVVRPLADDYRAGAVQDGPPSAFSFKEDGTFRGERNSGGAARAEEGSYLISAAGEIVLYVEAGNGERLSGARVERYKIEAESESELRLRRGATATLLSRKK
jgi:hypothetical protein